MKPLQVLYEDNHLLVIDKPAGLPTMGVAAGIDSAVARAAAYLKVRYQKPGNVFVGVVSRLDRLVSGVLVFARTSKAASRLSEQFRQHSVEKIYWAWIEGNLQVGQEQDLNHWVLKDEARHRMQVVGKEAPGSQEARLRFQAIRTLQGKTLISVELLTGRKHQIRLQLADIGHPICGDQKYGAQSRFPRGIALHCHRLTISHPTRKEPVTFLSPLPPYWPSRDEYEN